MRGRVKAGASGFALSLLLLCINDSALADSNTVELDCSYHVDTVHFGSADRSVHIGVDFAEALVRVYPMAGAQAVTQSDLSPNAFIEGDHIVYHAIVTDDSISWSNTNGGGGALRPNDNWVEQVEIDRKSGAFSLVWNPDGGVTNSSGSCVKRSDTNKF